MHVKPYKIRACGCLKDVKAQHMVEGLREATLCCYFRKKVGEIF